ncbi:MAG: protein-L-isoaspartate(D-aspartate) O-methyltransferase [Candidatus Eiseniibacteriota bacterium]|jgi:protein-L-isoaspartate(D-aspartate) O-methyltransferase
MSDLEEAKRRMLDEHLRARGIRDERVLAALAAVPRERFVTADQSPLAYEDRALPIGCGQTISQPYIVGLTAQALELDGTETVLEVGAGSGYMAAVLARLARRVIAIERVAALALGARRALEELDVDSVRVEVADGRLGWPDAAPFEAIVVSAAASAVPAPLVEQLQVGGRLIMPLGADSMTQELTVVHRLADGSLQSRPICPCRFVPLLEGEIT